MITKLVDVWTEIHAKNENLPDLDAEVHDQVYEAFGYCAVKLVAALPVWTLIDWDTPWLSDDTEYMVESDGIRFIGSYDSSQRKFYEMITGQGIELHECSRARPLCDLDYPPE